MLPQPTAPFPGDAPEFIRALLARAPKSLLVRHEVNLIRTWVSSEYTQLGADQALWLARQFMGEERAGQHWIARDALKAALTVLAPEHKRALSQWAEETQDAWCMALLENNPMPVTASYAAPQPTGL